MKPLNVFGRLLWLIAVITLVTGAMQIVAPVWILRHVGADTGGTAGHFFSIIGMFMALFGGMTLHALSNPRRHTVPLLWTAFQKFGASTGVGLAVARGVFSPLALVVAGFDLFSGIIAFAYWRRISAKETS